MNSDLIKYATGTISFRRLKEIKRILCFEFVRRFNKEPRKAAKISQVIGDIDKELKQMSYEKESARFIR
jgi:hypothetical protein